ncbi:MAG: ABC transporter ATPase [Gammaproteobacteria bacterium]|nr:MAG: ABC transporter ATPase [Gammaproteobacteria bacterium]
MFVVSSFAATRYYRYVDENGIKVIRDSVPAELVHKGYDILGMDGRLLRTVPRALTKEEIEAIESKKQSGNVQAEKAAKQARADKKLLTIFSSPEDAERARDRKLEALDVFISIDKGNLARLKVEHDEAQQQAAEPERAGQEVFPYLVEKLDRIERQVLSLEENIRTKNEEKEQVRQQYARDIERLKFLIRQQAPENN